MSTPPQHGGGLSSRHEEVFEAYENLRQGGEHPPLTDYLPSDGPDRTPMLVELVGIDLECRYKEGESARVEDYLTRYPELASDTEACANLVLQEYRLRARREPDITLEEYTSRFPQFAGLLAERWPRSPSEPAAAGTNVRYQPLRLHACGGLGEVLVARDAELRREVALKRIQHPHRDDPSSRARFLREAEITGRLEHPGVVPVYGLTEDSGGPSYAMRFIDGEPLGEAISALHGSGPARTETPTLRRLLDRFLTVCNTIAYAHSKGIVHRDLKPANIMLGKYGETLVVDWGLAKVMTGEGEQQTTSPQPGTSLPVDTREGEILGTPSYMSPEQASGRGDLVGPASDVYGLGGILYSLLTGQPPHRGAHIRDMLVRVQRGEIVSPRQLLASVPRPLEAVCLKALSLRPEDRYASALDLASEIEHWLADEPVTAWPEPVSVRLRRWIARHGRSVTAAAASLIAALAVSVVGLFLLTAANTRERLAREAEGKARGEEEIARELAEQRQKDAERERDSAHLNSYISQMSLARRAWDDGRVGRVLELLSAHFPPPGEVRDLRGFEWYYLRGLCHGERFNLQGHDGPLTSVAYSPDGRLLATGGEDQVVRIWDTLTGKEAFTLKGHGGSVFSLAFRPDGKRLAAACADACVWIWDVVPDAVPRKLPGHANMVHGVAYHPDGTLLATAGLDSVLKLWDAESLMLRHTLRGHGDSVLGVAFSPDGKQLASASGDRTVGIWDTSTGKRIHTLSGHIGTVVRIAYQPDGKRLASASRDHSIRLWDPATGKHLSTLEGHSGPVHSVVYSRDGRRLASGGWDQKVRIWESESSKVLITHQGHIGTVYGVALSPDGAQVASVSDDRTARVWDAAAVRGAPTLRGHRGGVACAVFSPDGSRILSGGAGGEVKLWETATGKELLTMSGHTGNVLSVAFSPDGKRAVSGGADSLVRLWDLETGVGLAFGKGHTLGVTGVAYRPDGKRVASASQDHTARLWEADTGKELLTLRGHGTFVYSVAFSPDGRLLASSGADNAVRLWDAETGVRVRELKGHNDSVFSLSYRGDGKMLAAGTSEQMVRLWDLESFTSLRTVRAHTSIVFGVSFSRDGRRFASCGQDGQVKVWETSTGQEVLSLTAHTKPVRGVAFSPDSQRLLSASADETIKIWEGLFIPPELLLRREAIFLVRSLFERLIRLADVVEHLENAPDLSDELRRGALVQARKHRQSPNSLNDASWETASRPGADAAAYYRALLQAEECVRLDPSNAAYLNTLGVAQYRVGRFGAAIATLSRSEKLNAPQFGGSTPSDLAFLAMAKHRLGHTEEALATLARLRERMKQKRWKDDTESQDFLNEAEALVDPTPRRE